MKLEYAEVLSIIEINENVFDMVIKIENSDDKYIPGQFINIYPKSKDTLLPRPISICDYIDGKLRVIFKKVGKGTSEFSRYVKGESIKILSPLGNGYNTKTLPDKSHILIGGGLGIPPLIYLAKYLEGNIKVFLGFKNQSEAILVDEFKKITPSVYISTDDGSMGTKGNIIDSLKEHEYTGDYFYSCGPLAMQKSVSGYLKQKGKIAQISLEERMACGIGACVGCAVKTNKSDGVDRYLKVCKDGPVFLSNEVVWDES